MDKNNINSNLSSIASYTHQMLLEHLELLKINPKFILEFKNSLTQENTEHLMLNHPQYNPIALISIIDKISPSNLIAQASKNKALWKKSLLNFTFLNHELNKTRKYTILATGLSLPIRPNSQDLVYANLLINHINDFEAFFKQIYTILAHDGIYISSGIGNESLWQMNQIFNYLKLEPIKIPNMQKIGDLLIQLEFKNVVTDIDRFTLKFDSVRDIVKYINSSGLIYIFNHDSIHKLMMMSDAKLEDLNAQIKSIFKEEFIEQGKINLSLEFFYIYALKLDDQITVINNKKIFKLNQV